MTLARALAAAPLLLVLAIGVGCSDNRPKLDEMIESLNLVQEFNLARKQLAQLLKSGLRIERKPGTAVFVVEASLPVDRPSSSTWVREIALGVLKGYKNHRTSRHFKRIQTDLATLARKLTDQEAKVEKLRAIRNELVMRHGIADFSANDGSEENGSSSPFGPILREARMNLFRARGEAQVHLRASSHQAATTCKS